MDICMIWFDTVMHHEIHLDYQVELGPASVSDAPRYLNIYVFQTRFQSG